MALFHHTKGIQDAPCFNGQNGHLRVLLGLDLYKICSRGTPGYILKAPISVKVPGMSGCRQMFPLLTTSTRSPRVGGEEKQQIRVQARLGIAREFGKVRGCFGWSVCWRSGSMVVRQGRERRTRASMEIVPWSRGAWSGVPLRAHLGFLLPRVGHIVPDQAEMTLVWAGISAANGKQQAGSEELRHSMKTPGHCKRLTQGWL